MSLRAITASLVGPMALTGVLAGALLTGLAGTAQAAGDDWRESGTASYYSNAFNGRRTSSGAVYDATLLTAAHASLPLGSKVLVTMPGTGRSVVVTINDREGASSRRMLDLSRAAAAKLGLLGRGVATVELTRATSEDLLNAGNGPVEEVAEATDDDAAASVRSGRRWHGTRHAALRGARVYSASAHTIRHAPASAAHVRHLKS